MEIKVSLISHTPDPELVCASAARLCYSKSGIQTIIDKFKDGDHTSLLKKIIDLGHYSVIEHANFTFGVEGITRATSHQFVRHRIQSISQQSQRYVTGDSFDYTIPESIGRNEDLKQKFLNHIQQTQLLYNEMIERNIKAEDARSILPNAVETKLVFTMNARSMLNFFNHRCCNRAQKEIHDMADKMLKLVKPIAPTIFENAGPKCILVNCPEGSMTCGKLLDVRKKYIEF